MLFTLGTVVSQKSNGLLPAANHHFLNLGGNENFVTPLMVVVEILFPTQSEIDEETGELKSSKKGLNKYKCMYFSNKAMKFEEHWFTQNELHKYGFTSSETEKIDTDENESSGDETQKATLRLKQIHQNVSPENIKWGDIVRFKTVDEEAKKTKSFNNGEQIKGSKPLLTFTCPAMQVIGFSSVEKKEPLIDPYSGLKKREKSIKLVKCKFFNVESDKFSEQLVPVECLQKIDNSTVNEKLNLISDFIKAKSLVIVRTNDSSYFGKPQSVHVFSGRYQLVFYNELIKKNEFVWMDLIEDFDEINLLNSEYYPGINEQSNNLIRVNEFIQDETTRLEGKHFKITYRNLKEEIVSRYITVLKLSHELNDDELLSHKKYYYLKSFCHLREANREFRSDRILSIRTIKDQLLIDYLDSISK